ncbi:MAG: thiamine ABC transporter substrate-binding protein [Candidatus Promineifilaceae bacterium]|nr:thiamine ABC transporter substrate-binding protein [Candidatus Promineifilaceae bacterium]
MIRKVLTVLLLLLTLALAACGADDEEQLEGETGVDIAAPAADLDDDLDQAEEEVLEEEVVEADEAVTLTLMTHDSFDISEETILRFEEAHDVNLELLPAGDTGTALNQAILAADNPLADVFFGVDNTFLSRALDAGIFETYESPLLAEIPDRFELDESHRMLPVDFGDVCLNYDVAWFEERGLEPPDSLDDLVDPAYEGLLVVESPATSSPGLAFLLTTIANYGTDGNYTYLNYWADLENNDVLVVNDWNSAYYGHFSVAGDGNRPLVVSYASSPPAEVIFADPRPEEAPSASVVAPDTCFRQIEFVGILGGTEQRELAEALVDYMLSEPFQEDIPLHMFVFPVNENAELPAEFVEFAAVPDDPATVAPELIDENRERWIESWSETMVR